MRPTLLAVAGAALLTAGAPASDEFPVSRTQNHSTQQSTLATAGPSPVVTAVAAPHGSDGLAVEISHGGVLAVAPCWFSGGHGEGTRFITPIACTDAPPLTPAASDIARRTVDVLLQAVRHLPNGRPDRAALY